LKYHLVWYSGFSRMGVLGDPNICREKTGACYQGEWHSVGDIGTARKNTAQASRAT
jgi:hypothetical protein